MDRLCYKSGGKTQIKYDIDFVLLKSNPCKLERIRTIGFVPRVIVYTNESTEPFYLKIQKASK